MWGLLASITPKISKEYATGEQGPNRRIKREFLLKGER
jgi:hypothetical protein